MQLVQCVLIKHLCKTEVARVMKYSKSQTSVFTESIVYIWVYGLLQQYNKGYLHIHTDTQEM